MAKTLNVEGIRLRGDTAANWETKNPVLLENERVMVVVDGVVRTKTGDGTSSYSELPFDDESLYAAIGEKMDIQWSVSDNGKYLRIDEDGKATPMGIGGTVTWGDLKGN